MLVCVYVCMCVCIPGVVRGDRGTVCAGIQGVCHGVKLLGVVLQTRQHKLLCGYILSIDLSGQRTVVQQLCAIRVKPVNYVFILTMILTF